MEKEENCLNRDTPDEKIFRMFKKFLSYSSLNPAHPGNEVLEQHSDKKL